ncbi:pyrroline-5-carboxylate reductase [soil metagenome]
MVRLQIVGGGRMGEALLSGLLAAGWAAPSELAVVEALPARREELAERYPDVAVSGACVAGDGTVVAVKPADVADACRAAAAAGTGRLLSIAAGVRLATLEGAAGDAVAVVRAMPNTPALVGAGVAALAAGRAASEDDLVWAEGVLGAVGTVVRVAEPLLDAVTGVSGSGPASLFLVPEALIEGGVLAGLPRDVSSTLAIHTVLGAGRLLVESGESPEVLRAAVTSPGGTTAAGLRALEAAGVRAALLDAVTAATERSRQLGG